MTLRFEVVMRRGSKRGVRNQLERYHSPAVLEEVMRSSEAEETGGRALRKRWGCAWPGVSAKHRLKAGVEATWRDGGFEVRAKGR